MPNTPIDPERDLELTRLIDAPRELIYDLWTDPAQLTHWWGPHGMTCSNSAMEPRLGGVFRTLMHAPDGQEYDHSGVFLDAQRPERIVMADCIDSDLRPTGKAFMTTVITFEEEGGKTRYTARALHPTAEAREQHEKMGFYDGWGQSLDRFEALVLREKASRGL